MTAPRKPRTPAGLSSEYELVRELGRGGTSIVYLGRERATGDEVAIKLIRAKFMEDDEAVGRIEREARFVAQLAHENIIPVRRVVDLKRGGVALVMEHVPGRTLRDMIRATGPLPVERAEQIIRQIAAALGAAHALGIVHRDVKPENIFVDESGRAMLADFGLARSMDGDTQLTMAGVAIGTPAYMAPEQIDGNDLDARGDVYSLGLVAWELLTGKRPWEGETLYAILYRQKYEKLPDVRDLRADVPDHFADAIAVAIEKDREARWQDVAAFVHAIEHGAPQRERQIPPRIPVSTETVQFVRPVTPPVAEALAAVAAELAATEPHRVAPTRRRFAMYAAGLIGLIAIAFIASAAQHRHKSNASAASENIVQTSSAGNVAAAVEPAPATPSVGQRSDSVAAHRPTLAVAAENNDPRTALQGNAADEAPSRDTLTARDSIVAKPTAPVKVATQQGTRDTPSPRPSVEQAPPTIAPAPIAPAPSAPVAAVSRVRVVAGGMHTCMITADGRAFCWGGNDRGQIGNGGTSRASSPAVVSVDVRFTTIAAGLSHSCGIARGGMAWCWGANDHGQLGDRTMAQHTIPLRVAGSHTFTEITVGAAHTCALDDSGAAWCWGSNAQGQLGAPGEDAAQPTPVAWRGRFISIAAGWNFTCAIEASGRAMCWGDDSAGELGDGGTTDRRAPVWVSGERVFTSIAAGSAHACGITPQHEVYCWGRNSGGQLGDGTRVDHSLPVRIKSSERFVAVAAGAVHTCALTAEGSAWCWGRNNYGQLGNGGTSDQTQPVEVAGEHSFATLRAFGSHTCGATPSGEAFCWGYNLEGQLGDGSRVHRTRPVYVEPPGGG
ncbi:MAG TPA: protein kinase [Gemmatimonadaceae bacterium]|nr:protein kinase [Gemmatimonadaceae bacterium]